MVRGYKKTPSFLGVEYLIKSGRFGGANAYLLNLPSFVTFQCQTEA